MNVVYPVFKDLWRLEVDKQIFYSKDDWLPSGSLVYSILHTSTCLQSTIGFFPATGPEDGLSGAQVQLLPSQIPRVFHSCQWPRLRLSLGP